MILINYKVIASLRIEDVLPLYEAVGWTNYTSQVQMLEQALRQSLYVLAAYDSGKLVGILRAVGDGVSIVFIQDIIVLPSYQRQGIGSQLIKNCLETYKHVYQIHLLTDTTDKTKAFYESQGFKIVEAVDCRAYTLVR